jgi:polyphosphate glucokinase
MAEDRTLVVDLGGKAIKLALGAPVWRQKLPSGRELTPARFVQEVQAATVGWDYDQLSVGCPGPVKDGRLTLEPVNLGPGWRGLDLAAAFHKPAKIINDAAMQALGSYEGGKMLFLGLGTGLGAALVADGLVLSLELAHLPYRDGLTFEDFTGLRGLERLGRAAWLEAVHDTVARLRAAMVADYVVLGGGNALLIERMPEATRPGRNENAIIGGQRLWQAPVRIL